MNVLINYADEKYHKVQRLNSLSGRMFGGFDKVIEYGPDDIDCKFKVENIKILENKRGNGLWLWKPYFILKTLNTLEDGDVLFYCDSAAFFVRKIKAVLEILKNQDIWISALPLIEKQFTQPSVFETLGCNEEKYTESPQLSGSFIAFKKSNWSIDFVKEWLKYCCNKNILDCDNEKEVIIRVQYPFFISHREDQSVLSLLAKKYGVKEYQDPSQYSIFPEKYVRGTREAHFYAKYDYKPFIVHHRKSNIAIIDFLLQTIYVLLPYRIARKVFLARAE